MWRANVLAGVYWLGSALFALWYLLIAGFRCDEGCGDGTGDWRYDRDAWQWDATGWSGGAALLVATAFAFALFGRSRSAVVLLVLHIGSLAFPLVLGGRVTGGTDYLALWLALVLLLEACGVAAIRAGRDATRQTPLLGP